MRAKGTHSGRRPLGMVEAKRMSHLRCNPPSSARREESDMAIRRFAPLALALAVLGCQADIPNQSPPSTIVFAITVPSATDATQAGGTPPLAPPGPNDLTLQAASCTPASRALWGCALPPPIPQPTLGDLQALVAAGGYPALVS